MGKRAASPLVRVVRIALKVAFRLYVLGVIVLVGWLSYNALRYLVVSLMFASPPPATITELPTRMDGSILRASPSSWAALQAAEDPRAPLAHYHGIDGWFQLDVFNGCTRSGCHGPMPHNERKEVRAFLNMHATSIHCGVCHIQFEASPLRLAWYSLSDGRLRDAPALVRAYGWLVAPEGRQALAAPTAAIQAELVQLLRTAAVESGGDHTLSRLAEELAAARHTSDVFQALVETARVQVPLRFHGQYGAKLALRDGSSGQLLLAYPNTEDAVTEFLQPGATADPAQRDALLERVHPRQRAQSLNCTSCHRPEKSLVDLPGAGYPPERIASLQAGWVFRAIESISEGVPLHLPDFASPDGEPAPASAPAANQP